MTCQTPWNTRFFKCAIQISGAFRTEKFPRWTRLHISSTSKNAYSNRPDQGPEVIKLFSCSTQPVTYTQLSTKVQLLVKTKLPTIEEVFALDLLDFVFIMLINAKSILTFMSRKNFVFSWVSDLYVTGLVEYDKCFITSVSSPTTTAL